MVGFFFCKGQRSHVPENSQILSIELNLYIPKCHSIHKRYCGILRLNRKRNIAENCGLSPFLSLQSVAGWDAEPVPLSRNEDRPLLVRLLMISAISFGVLSIPFLSQLSRMWMLPLIANRLTYSETFGSSIG